MKGWPGGRTWNSTSTLPVKQKFGIDISNGAIVLLRTTYYLFDPIAFAMTFSDPNDLNVLVDEMARYLLNVEPSDPEHSVLFDTILDGGKDYEWNIEDVNQRPDERIRKFLQAAVQLAKFQLY